MARKLEAFEQKLRVSVETVDRLTSDIEKANTRTGAAYMEIHDLKKANAGLRDDNVTLQSKLDSHVRRADTPLVPTPIAARADVDITINSDKTDVTDVSVVEDDEVAKIRAKLEGERKPRRKQRRKQRRKESRVTTISSDTGTLIHHCARPDWLDATGITRAAADAEDDSVVQFPVDQPSVGDESVVQARVDPVAVRDESVVQLPVDQASVGDDDVSRSSVDSVQLDRFLPNMTRSALADKDSTVASQLSITSSMAESGDVTIRPSQPAESALDSVRKSLDEELAHLRDKLRRYQQIYDQMDSAMGKRKRKGLKMKIEELMSAVDSKSDAIYNLHDAVLATRGGRY